MLCCIASCGQLLVLIKGYWVALTRVIGLPGCREDAENLLKTSSMTQLATWCAVYKSEIDKLRKKLESLTDSSGGVTAVEDTGTATSPAVQT